MAKKKPFSGKLNQHIEIHASDNVQNSTGGVVPRKVLYWATSAEVVDYKSIRIEQAGQTQFLDGFKFTIRDRVDKNVTPKMVIKWREGWLTIVSCDPDYVYSEFLVIKAIWSRLGRRYEPVEPVGNQLFNELNQLVDTGILIDTEVYNLSI